MFPFFMLWLITFGDGYCFEAFQSFRKILFSILIEYIYTHIQMHIKIRERCLQFPSFIIFLIKYNFDKC